MKSLVSRTPGGSTDMLLRPTMHFCTERLIVVVVRFDFLYCFLWDERDIFVSSPKDIK